MSFLTTLFGDPSQRIVKRAYKIVDQVNIIEAELHNKSDQAIQQQFEDICQTIQQDDNIAIRNSQFAIELLALAKSAARRLADGKHSYEVMGHQEQWNMIPYDVQIIGAYILLQGKITEMKTGEGKTLVAGLAAVVAAATGKGIHIVTVNDYLAQRDAETNIPLFDFFGIRVATITNGNNFSERKAAYQADVTYVTNNELGFDYLRDNMAQKAENMVQRDLHFAIVDEVDSILIDESRTPLIISAPAESVTEKYQQYNQVVSRLTLDTDYLIDEKRKTTTLTESGIKHMERILGVDNIYAEAGITEVHHLEQALKARACYTRDIDYVVEDGSVVIIDEFTGRKMPGRRFGDGLHQAIEAKEKVEIKRQSKTLATITFQNYFRLYENLSGMTGTAKTEEEECIKIYGLEVAQVPTNMPITRQDLSDVIFQTEQGKFQAIVQEIKAKHATGQPVLIGTVSIEKSEHLSKLLTAEGIAHEVLNAKHHEREAEIVANAGQKGAVTIATNMAGRGTDIKLGDGVKELGGLSIIGSERHESRRIDNQLRGRAGRQGDPGETQFYLSLEDTLLRLFGGERMQRIVAGLSIPEDQPIATGFISRSVESAQKKVEGHHFDIRKHVVQYDDILSKQRGIIYNKRRDLLQDTDIHGEVLKWLDDEIDTLSTLYLSGEPHEYDLETFAKEISAIHAADAPTPEQYEADEYADKITAHARTFLTDTLNARAAELPDPAMLKEAERVVTLSTIDQFWMEHIDAMTHLRDEVNLRAYAQKNPLQEYQREGYKMFVALLKKIHGHVVRTLFQANIQVKLQPAKQAVPKNIVTNASAIAAQLVNTGEYNLTSRSPRGTEGELNRKSEIRSMSSTSIGDQKSSHPYRIRAEASHQTPAPAQPSYTKAELKAMPRAERRRIEKMMKKQK